MSEMMERRGSVVVSPSACHAASRGSLPGPGASQNCLQLNPFINKIAQNLNNVFTSMNSKPLL